MNRRDYGPERPNGAAAAVGVIGLGIAVGLGVLLVYAAVQAVVLGVIR